MKKPNQAYIGFIVINNDLVVQVICFTVNFSGDKVKNVFRKDNEAINTLEYSQEGGNVLIQKNKLLCYGSKNFINRRKRVPDSVYKRISPSFISMRNKERLKILNEFSMR